MASKTIIVSGRVLTALGLTDEQLARLGVVVQTFETVDFSRDDVGYALLDGLAGGKDLLAEILHLLIEAPRCRILVVVPDSSREALAYLRAGAIGLLKAPMSEEQLNAVLKRVWDGHIYLDSEMAQILAMRQIKKMLQPFDELTSREYDVFCMLAEGFKLQQIADELDVTSKTVSNCQSQIKLKLSLANRAALKKLAKKHGVVAC